MKSETELQERLDGIGAPIDRGRSPWDDIEPQKRGREEQTIEAILSVSPDDREEHCMKEIARLSSTGHTCDPQGTRSGALTNVERSVYEWAARVPPWLPVCDCGKAWSESNDWPFKGYCWDCIPDVVYRLLDDEEIPEGR